MSGRLRRARRRWREGHARRRLAVRGRGRPLDSLARCDGRIAVHLVRRLRRGRPLLLVRRLGGRRRAEQVRGVGGLQGGRRLVERDRRSERAAIEAVRCEARLGWRRGCLSLLYGCLGLVICESRLGRSDRREVQGWRNGTHSGPAQPSPEQPCESNLVGLSHPPDTTAACRRPPAEGEVRKRLAERALLPPDDERRVPLSPPPPSCRST